MAHDSSLAEKSRQIVNTALGTRSLETMVVPDDPAPSPAKMLDIEMLVMTVGGKERTAQEFEALFASSGFRLGRIVPTSRPISVIEGLPI